MLPTKITDVSNALRRLSKAIIIIDDGLKLITGEGDPDSGDDLPPIAVVPTVPGPIVPAAGAAPMAAGEPMIRSSLAVSMSQIVRNAFDKKGPMTTNQLFAYLEKTGMMTKIRESCGDQARNKVKKVLYELRKQEFLVRTNGKATTPWVPTPEFNVRQNHLKSIGDSTPSIEGSSWVVESSKDDPVKAEPPEPAHSSAAA